MSNARRLHYTHDEYLKVLASSTVKLEYCDGVIYAMAGGTVAHAELAAAVTALLRNALQGRCRVFSSELKVRVESSDLFTFPDVSVVCGELETSKLDAHALTNPSLLVEVTSRSTEDYDRGEKLSHYKQIPSLRAVLFLSHRERRITLVHRSAGGWDETDRRSGERVVLDDPACSLAVDDVYAGIALDSS